MIAYRGDREVVAGVDVATASDPSAIDSVPRGRGDRAGVEVVAPDHDQRSFHRDRVRVRAGRPCPSSLNEDGQPLAQPRLVTDGDVKGGRYVSEGIDLVVGQAVAPFGH